MLVICHNTISCPKPVGVCGNWPEAFRIASEYLGVDIKDTVNYGAELDRETKKRIHTVRINVVDGKPEYFTFVEV